MTDLTNRLTMASIPGRRRAEMRVVSDAREGEFHHVGTADHAGAGGSQPGHCGAIALCRRCVFKEHRASSRHLALDVKEVFDGNAQTRQRSLCNTR